MFLATTFGKIKKRKIGKMNKATVFNEIVKERRSVRKFDTSFNFDHEAVTRSIERAILSANSSNMQLWEFYRIKSTEAKLLFTEACLGQNAAKTASELVVFVARPDLWKDRVDKLVAHFLTFMPDKTDRIAKMTYQYYEEWIPFLYDISNPEEHDEKMRLLIAENAHKPFAKDVFSRDIPIITHKSVALAAQTFMLSIKAEGYDSCPMEGHDSEKVKEILKLPKTAEISMIVGIGKGMPNGIYGERFRIPYNDVVFEL